MGTHLCSPSNPSCGARLALIRGSFWSADWEQLLCVLVLVFWGREESLFIRTCTDALCSRELAALYHSGTAVGLAAPWGVSELYWERPILPSSSSISHT